MSENGPAWILIQSTRQPEDETNGEQWSERQCGLPTQKSDVPDNHPGDAEEKKEKKAKNWRFIVRFTIGGSIKSYKRCTPHFFQS